jgi:hypothetical protein
VTERGASAVLGRWRIVEIEGWDADYVDMLGPGHFQFDRDGVRGHDEMTEVAGDGDADLEPDGTLTGEIRFHHGDEMPFTAKRW